MADALSGTGHERARKNLALILQRLASVGQVAVAEGLSVSEATVSRFKAEQAEQLARVLAILGLKVVPQDMRCYRQETIAALFHLAKAHFAELEKPEQLAWDD